MNRKVCRWCVVLACFGVGCSRDTNGRAAPPAVTVAPAPALSTPSSAVARDAASSPAIEDWIETRLRVPKRALESLGGDAPAIDTARHGVIGSAAYRVEGPALWLLVYRFRHQRYALDAKDAILEALESGPPYSNRTSVTGAYLLVVGFPSDKPVSPEMERVQIEYVSAFAGEE